MRLVEGRTFTESDDQHGAPVVIVDERLARRTWPGESAIGRRLGVDPSVAGTPSTWATVVGVVRHVRHRSPTEEVRDQVYFPERQIPRNPSVYLIKTAGDPAALVGARPRRRAPARRGACRSTTCGRSTVYVERRAGHAAIHGAARRAVRAGGAAAGLRSASTGSSPTRSPRGIASSACGWRSARGPVQCSALVVREGTALAVAGLALGLVGAAAGAWWLRSQLFGVAPWDPVSLAATLPILAVASLAACLVPALRAAADRSRRGPARRLTAPRGDRVKPTAQPASVMSSRRSVSLNGRAAPAAAFSAM